MILLLKESRSRRSPRRDRKGTRGSDSRPETSSGVDHGEVVEAGSDPGDLLPIRSGICAVQYAPVSEAGVQSTWCQGIVAQRIGECGQTFEDRLTAAVGCPAVDAS